MPVTLRRTDAAAILPLRHAVLRPGLPAKAAVYQPDDAPDTAHFGVYDGDALVGCVTVHLDPLDGQPAWRLRGMAVDASARQGGVGRQLVKAVEDYVRAAGGDAPRRLWCNARLAAVGFYEKCGWRVVSGVYDIPGVGPHVKMTRDGCQTDANA